MMIKREDILAYQIEEEIVCPKCVGDDEHEEAEEDPENVLTARNLKDKNRLRYCDRCEKLIKA